MIKRTTRYIPAALVSLLTFAVYLVALRNDFVVWDDDLYIIDNPFIRSLDGSFFTWAFTSFYASNWHPLTWLSHALDHAVWGLDPRGHHLTSILFHAANTFLAALASMFLLEAHRERAARTGAVTILTVERIALAGAVTGFLFGLHPLHVESAAWLAERKDVLCGFFVLLSITAYSRFTRAAARGTDERRGTASQWTDRWYILSLASFVLALLSKPMAVSLPIVLLVLDWHPFGRLISARSLRLLLLEKLPFIALSILSSVLTILAQRAGGAMEPLAVVPPATRMVVAAHSLIAYLVKMLVPVGLLPLYPYPRDASLLSPQYGGAVLLVAGITAASIVIARKQRLWLSVWGYYVVVLLPVLGVVQVGLQPMADRYTYLSSLGPFLLAGLAAAWLMSRLDGKTKLGRTAAIAAACLVAAALIVLTVRQISTWKNTVDLWTAVISRAPESLPEAYFKRGNAYREMGQHSRALADYDRMIALDPSFSQVYINRGALWGMLGRFDHALRDFTTAIELEPSLAMAYSNRSQVFIITGRFGDALQDLDQEIALAPASASAHVRRGQVHLKLGSRDRASADFRTACAMGDQEACMALKRMGR